MISKFDIAKALRDQTEAVCTTNSYALLGSKAKPNAGDTYILAHLLPGDDNPIGYGSTAMQKGVYQLAVYTPKNKSDMDTFKMTDNLTSHFSRGLKLTHNGQMLVIGKTSSTGNKPNTTHNIVYISVYFSVIG